MGKGSVLSFSNFFDIVDLNRDVEASMEFFCSSVCFMHFAAWYDTHLNLKLIVSSWAHAVRQSRCPVNSLVGIQSVFPFLVVTVLCWDEIVS